MKKVLIYLPFMILGATAMIGFSFSGFGAMFLTIFLGGILILATTAAAAAIKIDDDEQGRGSGES